MELKLCKFLEAYRIFTANNETPENIHIWTGLSTLAGACEKRLWIDRGIFKIYFNLYLAIIAPPGVCAKSTSIGLGANLLRQAGYNVFEDSVLKEKIIEEMCELEKAVQVGDIIYTHSSITYVASELNILLSSGVDMVKFLVNIWDKEDRYVYKTKNSGVYEVNRPYFNLIGAAVPEWFGDNVLSDINSTGFLARLIIVYEEEKRMKQDDPTPTPEQQAKRKECLDILINIGDMFGEITLTQDARDFYKEWYHQQDIDTTQDSRIVSYLERKVKTHVLKVAGLNAVGDLRDKITVSDLETAITLLDAIEPRLKTVILMAASNRIAPYVNKVRRLLHAYNGKVPMRDLVTTFYTDLTKDQLRELLALVEELGYGKLELVDGKRCLVGSVQY